ncbi:hypothetical protein HK102_010934, partial [Quaeritorhiza haematococci]
ELASKWTLAEKDALLKFAPKYFEYMNGSDKGEDEIFNISKEFYDQSIRKLQSISERASKLDVSELNDAERSDLEFLKDAIETLRIDIESYGYEIPTTHLVGCVAQLGMEIAR